jgi:hypothetical protein
MGSRDLIIDVERGAVRISSWSLTPPNWLRSWVEPKDAVNFSYGIMPPIGNRRPKWRNDLLPWIWTPSYNTGLYYARPSITLPLWLGMMPAAAGAWMVWRVKRSKIGCCAACGYDLAGLPAMSVCPECGAPTTPHHAAPGTSRFVSSAWSAWAFS